MGSRAERSWTVLELLQWTQGHFQELGIESARLDAEVLLAHALGCKRLQLYVDFEKPVLPEERARFRELVLRRGRERVPVSQLVESKEFWSLPLRVSGDVLTPRPETESLVQVGLDLLDRRLEGPEGESQILDLGTGSGCIALAFLSERPKVQVTATDVSPAALQIASENADLLQLKERLRLLEGDLFEAVPGEQFDLIVSNPPYVARRDAGGLPPELKHEPELALFGGDDGTAVLRRLIESACEALLPGGAIAMEMAPDQTEQVADWSRAAGLEEVEIHRDLGQRPRVVAGRRPGAD